MINKLVMKLLLNYLVSFLLIFFSNVFRIANAHGILSMEYRRIACDLAAISIFLVNLSYA